MLTRLASATVFNIGGNDFRLVVQIDFEAQVIYIRKVMNHAEYSRKKRRKVEEIMRLLKRNIRDSWLGFRRS